MDHAIYLAMTGATQTMRAQAENNYNLANISTDGFKSKLAAFQSVPVLGSGLDSRVNAVSRGVGYDFSDGPQITTGNPLDVAVQGQGWIAVQAANGSEAYTRDGALQVNASGMLVTANGQPVLGDSGPITVPPNSTIKIGSDGTISLVPLGQSASSIATVGRIKLVDPPLDQLTQGADGLMQLAGGGTAPAAANVRLASGVLEGSNVNPATALVNMIALSRQFELQVRSIKTADQNGQAATQLLSLS